MFSAPLAKIETFHHFSHGETADRVCRVCAADSSGLRSWIAMRPDLLELTAAGHPANNFDFETDARPDTNHESDGEWFDKYSRHFGLDTYSLQRESTAADSFESPGLARVFLSQMLVPISCSYLHPVVGVYNWKRKRGIQASNSCSVPIYYRIRIPN
jgi:hypothetical protein